jgi:hypothetical protein
VKPFTTLWPAWASKLFVRAAEIEENSPASALFEELSQKSRTARIFNPMDRVNRVNVGSGPGSTKLCGCLAEPADFGQSCHNRLRLLATRLRDSFASTVDDLVPMRGDAFGGAFVGGKGHARS